MSKYKFLTDPERVIFHLFQNNLITLDYISKLPIGETLLSKFNLNNKDISSIRYTNRINRLKMLVRCKLDLDLEGDFEIRIYNKYDNFSSSGSLKNIRTSLIVDLSKHDYLRYEYAKCICVALGGLTRLNDSKIKTDQWNTIITRHTSIKFSNVVDKHTPCLFDANYKKAMEEEITAIT